MLKVQILDFDTIYDFTSNHSYHVAEARLERWSEQTATLLQQMVGTRESTAFVKTGEGYTSLSDGGEARAARLRALVHEIEFHSDLFIRDEPSPTGVATGGDTVSEHIENRGDSRRVFVVHGRNGKARDAMFDFLRALGLQPMEWEEAVNLTGKGSPYIGEILDAGFAACRAAVILLTGDDQARLRPEYQSEDDPDHERNLTLQPRQNVTFEAGIAFGLYPARTLLVEIGRLRPMSDISGRHTVHFRGTPQDRETLKGRLRSAGCAVTEHGTDWLRAGDFPAALTIKSEK